ncbi:hypothetical protein RRG08_039830, partial [Elysia crispata]
IVARLKNKAKEVRHIRTMTVLSSFYTGVPGKRIKGSRFDVMSSQNGALLVLESDLTLDITTDEYLDKLNPEQVFRLTFPSRDHTAALCEVLSIHPVQAVPDNNGTFVLPVTSSCPLIYSLNERGGELFKVALAASEAWIQRKFII